MLQHNPITPKHRHYIINSFHRNPLFIQAFPATGNLYKYILQRDRTNTCFYCGKKLSDSIAVDHLVPWKLVREDRIWNFVLACKSCNSKKNDRIPEKQKMIVVLERNERIARFKQPQIEKEFNGYSAEMFMRLWQYAKIGGYKEYQIEKRKNDFVSKYY